ncbi:unknown protein [Paenibacillus amylolyticus]|uniref:Uncharacterized protein n=1 Tax=Paenibacillus amylolyticus TaxID=1451 RepID=A0A124DYC4_PAEAM|nr:unknown protein [Paenibacillus amylolyticus]
MDDGKYDDDEHDDEYVHGRNDVQNEIHEDDDGMYGRQEHDGRHGYE